MKATLRLIPTVLILLSACIELAGACTTAVVAGSATPDGRPLLFKNRDTGSTQNTVRYFEGERYAYIGVVDAADTLGTRVWQGVNEAGFAIMNSMSYNINYGDTTRVKDRDNGTFMKQALETCGTIDDFRRMIESEQKPLGVEANFGVIDARGGAGYFETGNDGCTFIDANDPTVAPFGYLIRTNYSFADPVDKGHGYIRYRTAATLFADAEMVDDITPSFILRDVTRCLKNSLIKTDLHQSMPADNNRPEFVFFEDYIPRHSTASATVIQGVLPDESPDLTTMWTIPGFTPCSVAVPAWVATGGILPAVISPDKKHGTAPLNEFAFKLKRRCFPIERGSGNKYIDLGVLINAEGDGCIQLLRPLENEIMARTTTLLDTWRTSGFSKREAVRTCRWIDTRVTDEYRRLFGFEAQKVADERIRAEKDNSDTN